MSSFRVIPNILHAQRDELETAYRDLCRDVSELGSIIRQLGTMSGFDTPIETLRHIQQKGNEQQVKLRQSAKVLGSVAEFYTQTELNCLDEEKPGRRNVRFAVLDCPLKPVWEPRKMIPDTEALFGTKVVIRRRD